MDLRMNESDLAFQQEVRSFLKDNLPENLRQAASRCTNVLLDKDLVIQWQQILAKNGWAVPHWPEEWGGTDWTPTQHYIFTTECFRAGAPRLSPFGLRMLAPVLLAFGSEDQKKEFLPPMLSGEHYWCQGYSEPGSGSDLASLKLRAERQGDHYVLNGSKIWQTHAHFATHIFCLVRTDNSGKPQQGISFMLMPLDLPGITVEPIISMSMDHEVNQVFFDNVKVPAKNLVGQEGMGWRYAKYLLEFERGGAMTAQLRLRELDKLKKIAAVMKNRDALFDVDNIYDRAIARLEIDIKALEMIELSILSSIDNPGAESSVTKFMTVDIQQRIQQLGVDLIGYNALIADNSLVENQDVDTVVPSYLNGRATSIYGGTKEIQMNIVAKSILGL